MSEEQIDFMLEFLTTNLEQIFLEDFNAGMFTYFLESDKELLKIYIKDILTHFFQINTLQKRSNNLNFGINPEKEREENENP
ncbi:MAG: hypothetical protein LBO09_02995 [Candidatus Peribacteria bacterium]|jgi:hypothetical protein|nr:hypothetical protein [Candidatus Peribacteria bacterium]